MSKIILTNQKRKRLSYHGNSIVEHKFTIHVALLSILITFRKDCRFTAASRKFLSYSAAMPRDLVRIGSNDNQFITSQKLLSYLHHHVATVNRLAKACMPACQHVCNCINNIDEMYKNNI